MNMFLLTVFAFSFIASCTYASIGPSDYSPISAEFEYQTLPTPGQEAVVRFELRISSDVFPSAKNTDWNVRVYDHGAFGGRLIGDVQWLGDSSLVWRGPHSVGDVFEGLLSFLPITSGKTVIGLKVDGPSPNGPLLYTTRFCLDDRGSLHSYGKKQWDATDDFESKGTFITGQEIELPFHDRTLIGRLFSYGVIITPLPSIDSISTVRINLTAMDEFESGLDMVSPSPGLVDTSKG